MDMVMHFVNQENDAEGNLFDVRIQNIDRHMGTLTLTGKNNHDKVQNLYDLEGNAWEWVSEKNNTTTTFVNRGDSIDKNGSSRKTSGRYSYLDDKYPYGSFRVMLYIL